jgi:hypothetical protein
MMNLELWYKITNLLMEPKQFGITKIPVISEFKP